MNESRNFVEAVKESFTTLDPEDVAHLLASYMQTSRSKMWGQEAALEAISAEADNDQRIMSDQKEAIDGLKEDLRKLDRRNNEIYNKARGHFETLESVANTILVRLADNPSKKAWKIILDMRYTRVRAHIGTNADNVAAKELIKAIGVTPYNDRFLSLARTAVEKHMEWIKQKTYPKKLRKFIKKHKGEVKHTHYDNIEIYYVEAEGDRRDYLPLGGHLDAKQDVWVQVKHPRRLGCSAGHGWYRRMTDEEYNLHIPF